MRTKYPYQLVFCLVVLLLGIARAQTIPTPQSHFGFAIGDDYQLANFTQTEAYFKKLDESSDRMELTTIGQTEEGRNQYMFFVSSPDNLKNLARYKEISQKMARAEGLTDAEAKALSLEGKAVVWIDGGLHATEVVGIHQLIETAYNLASRQDAETKNILDKVIILLTHANPDGQELVSNWYMRQSDPKKRSTEHLPRLYQKYIGHDNNRDFYIMNMKESQNMGRQLFLEWIPQIMYNHHQRGPAGSVLAGPPYRDPFNYVFDPADGDGHRCRRGRHVQPFECGKQTGLYPPDGFHVLYLVQRGPSHHHPLSQHDRPSDRDNWKPYPRGNSAGTPAPDSQQQYA